MKVKNIKKLLLIALTVVFMPFIVWMAMTGQGLAAAFIAVFYLQFFIYIRAKF